MKKNWLSKKVKIGAVTGMLVLSVLGAYSAYTSVTETKSNTFNIVASGDGSPAGQIEEPNWNAEKGKDMLPLKTVAKDPKVVSTVGYETWVFLTVEVPTFHATLDGTEGIYDTVVPNFNTDGKWIEIKSEKSSVAGKNSKYTYGYKEKVTARGETSSLFTEFSVPDFTKTEGISSSIDVYGKMIQTEGFKDINAAATALGLD